jgi:ribosomal protein L40E
MISPESGVDVQGCGQPAEEEKVSDDRCRACGAALAPEAGWCSLCFTEVRQPAPIEPPVQEAVTLPAVELPVLVTVPPTALTEADAPVVASAEAVNKPARHRAEATWPCPQCEARVPMSLDTCEECGGQFLSGAVSSLTTSFPIVGDVGAMGNGQRLLVAAGISCVFVFLFVAVFFIGGTIF